VKFKGGYIVAMKIDNKGKEKNKICYTSKEFIPDARSSVPPEQADYNSQTGPVPGYASGQFFNQ